jgi:hypothetical protein
MEAWKLCLPTVVLNHILDEMIYKKMNLEVERELNHELNNEVNSEVDRDVDLVNSGSNSTSISQLLEAWKPLMEDHLELLHQKLKNKLAEAV